MLILLLLRPLEFFRREHEGVDDAVEARPDSPQLLHQACPILHVADDQQIEIAGA